MSYFLGPLGDLRELPPVERDQKVTSTGEAPQGETEGLEGGVTVDRLGRVRRSWVLPWVYLTQAEKEQLDAIRRGLLGGPLWLLDPTIPNLAHPLVSSGGSERRSARTWEVSAAASSLTWTSTARAADVGSVGAISWTRTLTGLDDLSVGRTRPSQRTPMPPAGGAVRVRSTLRRTSATAFSVRFGTQGWKADGTLVATLSAAVVLGTDWTEFTSTWAAPPADVVAFAPFWRVEAGQPAGTLEVGRVGVGHGTGLPAFGTGGGASRVFVRSMTESQPSEDEWDVTLTLAEA